MNLPLALLCVVCSTALHVGLLRLAVLELTSLGRMLLLGMISQVPL